MFTRIGYFVSVLKAVKELTLNEMIDSLSPAGGHFEKRVAANNPRLYVTAEITINGVTYRTDKALFDTGAFVSGASREFLPPALSESGVKGIAYGVGSGPAETPICRASISLPGGITFPDVELWLLSLPENVADVIIGMDLIAAGELRLERDEESLLFSFKV